MDTQQEQNIYYLVLVGTIIIFILVFSIVFFFYMYQKKMYRQQQEMSGLLIRHQEELLYANWEKVEDERKRISSEFHDDIGSIFSTLSLMLGSLSEKQAFNEDTESVLRQSQDLIDAGVKNMRRILYNIVPPDIDIFGLNSTILILCERINSASQVLVSFQEKGVPSSNLTKQQQLTLYRIIQELTNNTLKHADATRAEIKLEWTNDNLLLHYTDDGKGLGSTTSNVKGLGLRNITSRAKMIQAEAFFDTTVSRGMFFNLKLSTSAYHE
jgi:two-component system, NarL family, sensor kinase